MYRHLWPSDLDKKRSSSYTPVATAPTPQPVIGSGRCIWHGGCSSLAWSAEASILLFDVSMNRLGLPDRFLVSYPKYRVHILRRLELSPTTSLEIGLVASDAQFFAHGPQVATQVAVDRDAPLAD